MEFDLVNKYCSTKRNEFIKLFGINLFLYTEKNIYITSGTTVENLEFLHIFNLIKSKGKNLNILTRFPFSYIYMLVRFIHFYSVCMNSFCLFQYRIDT